MPLETLHQLLTADMCQLNPGQNVQHDVGLIGLHTTLLKSTSMSTVHTDQSSQFRLCHYFNLYVLCENKAIC